MDEDQTLTVPAPGALTNDTDVEGDFFVASLVGDVTDGTLTFTDGSFEYVPNADFDGVDTFTSSR